MSRMKDETEKRVEMLNEKRKEEIMPNNTNEIRSPIKAIRAFCIDCCGGDKNEVKNCPSLVCALKPFRFGKNPYIHREMTEEQREKATERLKRARADHA